MIVFLFVCLLEIVIELVDTPIVGTFLTWTGNSWFFVRLIWSGKEDFFLWNFKYTYLLLFFFKGRGMKKCERKEKGERKREIFHLMIPFQREATANWSCPVQEFSVCVSHVGGKDSQALTIITWKHRRCVLAGMESQVEIGPKPDTVKRDTVLPGGMWAAGTKACPGAYLQPWC